MINETHTHEEERRIVVELRRRLPKFIFWRRMGYRSYYRNSRCDGCGANFYADPGPVLVDGLWRRIARNPKDRLCDRCVRRQLGRPLRPYFDLKDCPWNTEWQVGPVPDRAPSWRGPYLMRNDIRNHWRLFEKLLALTEMKRRAWIELENFDEIDDSLPEAGTPVEREGKMELLFCTKCNQETDHRHLHMTLESGSHIVGTECFVCDACGFETYADDDNTTFPFTLDRRGNDFDARKTPAS